MAVHLAHIGVSARRTLLPFTVSGKLRGPLEAACSIYSPRSHYEYAKPNLTLKGQNTDQIILLLHTNVTKG